MAEESGKSMNEVSQFRLYVLRFFYAVLGIWQSTIQAPLFFHHEHWTQTTAVVHCFFLALALLSLVGIRSPLQMLPLLIYEILWKMIWVLGVALPLWIERLPVKSNHLFFGAADEMPAPLRHRKGLEGVEGRQRIGR